MTPVDILLVESGEEDREFMHRSLAAAGHAVQVAHRGEEGLKMFSSGVFDVVISEVDLAGMDGIEMIQSMHATDPALSPIVVSSSRKQETAVRALEAGARSFLSKPFSAEALCRRVDKAVRERRRLVNTQLLLGDLISHRSDLQVKVAERERYLNHLLDAAPFGILSTDVHGEVLTFNGHAERIYGRGQEDVVERPLADVFGMADFERIQLHSGDDPLAFKTQHLRECGQRFPVLVHCRSIKNETDRRIARLYVVEDRSEREEMESQLLYAERLSVLGQLAPRIAHEFKTPLQIISGTAELAMILLEEGQTAKVLKLAEGLLPAAEQMNDLVQQMLDLGKPEQSRQEEMDLGCEMEKILKGLEGLGVVKYCRIERIFDRDLPAVTGDPTQIEQVFRNLIVNAAQAVEESGRKELRLGVKALPECVEVRVEDSGPGITPENMKRIFQPFFTTKGERKGTGLGLPIVKNILDRHSASIEVDSKPGHGTSFVLKFPCPPSNLVPSGIS